VKSGGIAKAPFCSVKEGQACDEKLKDKISAEVRGTLYPKSPKAEGNCVVCGKKAEDIVYIAKSY